ncbi:LacI family DNA-binding transcriptional regulator [Asticcacaulis sp. SL142]|uniref:LacI family DNA-binding transcriptional regulator n=1 Tax=Asticcacaulis sp. SL142 TaxID=2995155 RepID=UPI00226CC787|nr:LacI family DNA-binding transcriptional regulator [Asticcacaulis sp. SL142]WAC47174.1 LacI family DNA-binding transcriptional regulator [Asticcacaulis sp. SL142]
MSTDPADVKSAKRVTLKDVAKAAEVSLASASYAINGTGSVGDQVRAHVLKIAEAMCYRQNLSARAMRTGRTGALGLILPDFANPFFTSLAQSVIRSARAQGYCVFVTDTEGDPNQERKAMHLMVERGVDGIVWFPIHDLENGTALINDTPTVVIDRTVGGIEQVHADYHAGGRLAAEHLVALGHKRIGVVSGPMSVLSMRERCAGAIAFIEQHAGLVFNLTNAFSYDLEADVRMAIERRDATAIFAGADLIALGVIQHASRTGLRVPDDLSVVGFDDIPWAQISAPPLTTIEMPVEEMAAEAIDALLRRVESRAQPRRKVVFETALIERKSTSRPL